MATSEPRRTSVLVVRDTLGQCWILAGPSTSPWTIVVAVDPATGGLTYAGIPGVDRFASEDQALQHLVKLAREVGIGVDSAARPLGASGNSDTLRGSWYAATTPSATTSKEGSSEFSLAGLKILARGHAILGYRVLAGTGQVLIATGTTARANLPGGHIVYTITRTKWVQILLAGIGGAPAAGPGGRSVPLPLSSQTQSKAPCATPNDIAELVTGFSLDSYHYYCETTDLTRPFPSAHSTDDPDPDFVWNAWLLEPLRRSGLGFLGQFLIQGIAISHSLGDSRGGADQWELGLLTRKSSRHPGTRYKARGLNHRGCTGNEMECDQIVWVQPSKRACSQGEIEDDVVIQKPESIPFRSYTWRRGTLPIWFRGEIRSALQEAEIEIREENEGGAFEHARSYFERLISRFGVGDPVTLVNLLRCSPDQPEFVLSETFQECVRRVRREIQCKSGNAAMLSTSTASDQIRLINFDWHNNFKNLGECKSVDGIWSLLRDSLAQSGLTAGTVRQSVHPTTHATRNAASSAEGREGRNFAVSPRLFGYADAKSDCSSSIATPTVVSSRQRGVLRYNCADSLDRTNLVTFYVGIQLVWESCRQLSIDVRSLPPGWEQRWEPNARRYFFIDHNKCETTWARPAADFQCSNAWDGLNVPFDLLRVQILPSVLSAIAKLYVLSGDMASQMYTGSPALHTSSMRTFIIRDDLLSRGGSGDFAQVKANESMYNGKNQMLSAVNNTAISLSRRVQNMIYDSKRHAEMNAFLGYSGDFARFDFPLKRDFVGDYEVVSRAPSSVILKITSCMFPTITSRASILCCDSSCGQTSTVGSAKRAWVCDTQNSEVTVWLSRPSCIRGVILTRGHGMNDLISPVRMDVLCGRTLDNLHPVLLDVALPHCHDDVRMLFLVGNPRFPGAGSPSELEINFCRQSEVFGEVYDFEHTSGGPFLAAFPVNLSGLVKYDSRVVTFRFFGTAGNCAISGLEILGQSILGNTCQVIHENEIFKSVLSDQLLVQQGALQGAEEEYFLRIATVLADRDLLQKASRFFVDVDQVMDARATKDVNAEILESLFVRMLDLENFRLENGIPAAKRDCKVNPRDLALLDPNGYIPYQVGTVKDITSVSSKTGIPWHGASPSGETRSTSNDACMQHDLIVHDSNNVNRCARCKMGEKCSPTLVNIDEDVSRSNFFSCVSCAKRLGRTASLIDRSSFLQQKSWLTSMRKGVFCALQWLGHCPQLGETPPQLREWAISPDDDPRSPTNSPGRTSPQQRMNGDKPDSELILLSNFPRAGLLLGVPTAAGSSPADVLLSPLTEGICGRGNFWKAPEGVRECTIAIVLSTSCLLKEIQLVVSPLGFTRRDAPSVIISASADLDDVPRSCGTWSTWKPEGSPRINGGDILTFEISGYEEISRILWLRFTLPESGELGPDLSPVPFLHAGRIRVMGKPATNAGTSGVGISASEKIAYKKIMHSPSRVQRKHLAPRLHEVSACFRRHHFGLQHEAVDGFSITVVNPRPDCQLRVVRVLGYRVHIDGVQPSYRWPKPSLMRHIVVPSVQQGRTLHFDLPTQDSQNLLSTLILEFVDTYGAPFKHSQLEAPDKVNIYKYYS